MEEKLQHEVLKKLAEKALKELEEAYKRVPETDNGKTYLWRGKERVKLLIDVLNRMEV
ncbi:hypothetical protein PAP_03280 [Palaeococcus pacificus DY20341]|uniref:Uncharacterized protein n=1 Tax=Palaeococcus pacificus DY20341 TaxID=1343739 RepID=A0A075LSI6_9EURY|nr:hypothetical protein [Palaeococcus pacificus]AIF69076.1 hypothetical protein PAP_03280 [Palaeococcus pacificus DY20341]